MASHFKPPYVPSYEGASAYLGTKDSRRITANTRLVRVNENCITLRLYETDIVQYRSNGLIVIKTDGHNTNTTRRYINGASPAHVSVTKGVQYAAFDGQAGKWNGEPMQVQNAF